MFAIALAATAFLGQDKPAIDHSAEAALKQLFTNAGPVRSAHIVLTYFGRADGDYYLMNRQDDLWLGSAGELRLASMSTMGDGSLLVSDGKSVMNDPLTDDDPIKLTDGGKALHDLTPREPLSFFLEGAAGYDSLVDTTENIVFTTAPAGKKAIELRGKGFGKMIVTYTDGSSEALPDEIDLYRSARRRDDGAEQPVATSKEYIRLVFVGHLQSDLFSVTPAKGMKVEDTRTKKN